MSSDVESLNRFETPCHPSWEIRWTHQVNTLNTSVFAQKVNRLEYVTYLYYSGVLIEYIAKSRGCERHTEKPKDVVRSHVDMKGFRRERPRVDTGLRVPGLPPGTQWRHQD